MVNTAANGKSSRGPATVGGMPIHAMLVVFPIVCLLGALVCDVLFWRSFSRNWADASLRLTQVGVVMGALAAAFGVRDFLAREQLRKDREAWFHFGGNFVAGVLALASLWLRVQTAPQAIVSSGMRLSGVVVLLLMLTAWYGRRLAIRYSAKDSTVSG